MNITEPRNQVSIDGKYLKNFEQIVLKQAINNHHFFKITVNHDELEALGSHTLDRSKAVLGKPVVITFGEMEFLGIVTNVKLVHTNGHHRGNIVLSGFSKTILLDGGRHIRSWADKGLATIVKEVADEAGVETAVNPRNKTLVKYGTQYNESGFTFLQRLGKQYNEWLYYDGVKLVFGKPVISNSTTLEYGSELDNLSMGIRTGAGNQSAFSYDAMTDTWNEATTKNEVEGLNELAMGAFNTSQSIFPNTATSHSLVPEQDKSEIETSLQGRQAATMADLNVLEASCNKQGLTVGSVIKVRSARWDGKTTFDEQNYGEYLIIEISHNAEGNNVYHSSFKAIPAGVAVLPTPKVDMPYAHAEIATVVDNEDPKSKGRVKVRFGWQKHQASTNWLRVLMPDAGSSDHKAQNRGHVFIPEVGDQVMVGFRYGDPNRPFVMGAVFNGVNGAGGGPGNAVKSIATRSGHILEFNDAEGSESITITDKNKNIICIDTANNSIKITAQETIDFEAKNINLIATDKITQRSQHMEVHVGQDKTVNIGGSYDVGIKNNYSIYAADCTETVYGSKAIQIEGNLDLNSSEANIMANKGDINVKGAGVAVLQGGGDVKVSKG
ncbi:type VI secretion system Vgr family protein [Flagellimonas marinaquae]|uniref:type VI secretion system Vgr family protein n=1 Tax=Flagellimonas marinaquae TaxID=254955 RepID=UPI0020758B91|nr:phage baseplate assembly protein V [Allomuricauda aquimarina]USD26879.1 phage baseplate assembly protein V [Allomuricauda aquimarina]